MQMSINLMAKLLFIGMASLFLGCSINKSNLTAVNEPISTNANETLSAEDEFEAAQLSHLALTQYYRWYQVYEVPFTARTIANQVDILADDVEIISAAGTTKGNVGLGERLKIFDGWLNAHHVKNVEVKSQGRGILSLEADIVYQNIRPDRSRYSYTIHYSTLLRQRPGDLPVFTRLELKPTGEVSPAEFTSAYATNRTKSLMHRWLYLIETAKGGHIENFRELLDPAFSLHFSDNRNIDSWQKFEAWIAENAGKVQKSTHKYRNFSVTSQSDNQFRVSVDFDWKAINTQGQNMIAETHHEWIVTNVSDERFARIKDMRVTLTKPYQVVK